MLKVLLIKVDPETHAKASLVANAEATKIWHQ